MQEINFDEAVEQILARDPRYARDAYTFVREALDYTQKLIGKENRGQHPPRQRPGTARRHPAVCAPAIRPDGRDRV